VGMDLERGVGRSVVQDVGAFGRLGLGTRWRGYQLEVARAIGRAVADGLGREAGLTLTVLFPRQAGKNQVSALVEAFLLFRYQRAGGSIVKTAPTFRPQLAISARRLERMLAGRLTRRAGSSEYFAGGIVSYSNEAKATLLGVDPALIERHGAVSPEVADAMAAGALDRFGADTAVSITGVAGPGGGTEAKPVGYVCWSIKLADGTTLARDTRLPGDRTEVRDRATAVAMHLLRRALRGEDSPV